MELPYLPRSEDITFPDPTFALKQPNGLLAIGGDLSPQRLIEAYKHGIFPWYESGQPILWWSPDPRAVLFLDEFKITKSLRKTLNKNLYTVTFNHAFNRVINACSQPRDKSSGTWITPDMIVAYQKLHQSGYAHSVETWQSHQLVGGLYGVSCNKIFCGESMFSHTTDASKVALYYLVEKLKKEEYKFIDCQILNPHLQSLGAREIPRAEFLRYLKQNELK